MIKWEKLYDEDDNVYYEAMSPYHNEGSVFMWRLRQRLEGGIIVWYEDHDPELMNGAPEVYSTLECAMNEIQDAHDEIIFNAKVNERAE